MSEVAQYIASLEKQIVSIRSGLAAQSAERIYVGTNDGTFGAEECCRVTGTGEPSAGRYTIYETVGGKRVVEGCDPDNAPGYFRANEKAKSDLAAAKKAMQIAKSEAADRIAELENEIRETRKRNMLTTLQAAVLSC